MVVQPRHGFTRTELLIVTALLITTAGLILPAIQKVREAAARAQCSNNVKQCCLAAHNFLDTHGFLASNPDTIHGRNGTLQDLLQPYLE